MKPRVMFRFFASTCLSILCVMVIAGNWENLRHMLIGAALLVVLVVCAWGIATSLWPDKDNDPMPNPRIPIEKL